MSETHEPMVITLTVSTFILGMILYTLLTVAGGAFLGMMLSRQSLYIAHYHASDEAMPILQGSVDLAGPEATPQPVKKQRNRR